MNADIVPPPARITADDLETLRHLLPPSAVEIVRAVGDAGATALLHRWPGVQISVPKHPDANPAGMRRWAQIAEVVGESLMPRLAAQFGGTVLEIPVCRDLLTEKRNRWLRRRFDDLVDPHGAAMAASQAVYELGLALAEAGQTMTWRQIQLVVDRTDALPDDRQGDLFQTT